MERPTHPGMVMALASAASVPSAVPDVRPADRPGSTGPAGGRVGRYEPDRGSSFIVYAVVCINGELRRCLRETCWQVHVPRTLKEMAVQVVRARDGQLGQPIQRPAWTPLG